MDYSLLKCEPLKGPPRNGLTLEKWSYASTPENTGVPRNQDISNWLSHWPPPPFDKPKTRGRGSIMYFFVLRPPSMTLFLMRFPLRIPKILQIVNLAKICTPPNLIWANLVKVRVSWICPVSLYYFEVAFQSDGGRHTVSKRHYFATPMYCVACSARWPIDVYDFLTLKHLALLITCKEASGSLIHSLWSMTRRQERVNCDRQRAIEGIKGNISR